MIDRGHVALLLRNKVLINVSNLVAWPIRTGIQRVCYEFCARWPLIADSIPFVELGPDRIGLLEPDFFDHVRSYFEADDEILRRLRRELDAKIADTHPGYYGIASARNRIIGTVSVADALESCRCVMSLEESLNDDFYSLAAKLRPEKIFNLCHDFLVWTRPEMFQIDWRRADNISISVGNRRRYTHNFFTSTATRDEYVTRINRGDTRSYAVIPPGADGMGRVFRNTVPEIPEFVVVGTLEPRKQPLRLLDAFIELQARGHDARLCFAGRMGWLKPEERARLEKAFDSYSWLRWVDAPTDVKLQELIRNCRATIYISQAEGFGSPPVESLALGVPCIVSAVIPSVRDMAPNGQIRVDPADTEALIDAVSRLLDPDEVAALHDEIRTLELPTWQGFVDGITALVVANTIPPASGARRDPTYPGLLRQLHLIDRIEEFHVEDLVREYLVAIDGRVGAAVIEVWQRRALAGDWSNREAIERITAEIQDGCLDPVLVSNALSGRLELKPRPSAYTAEWVDRLCSMLAAESDEAFEHGLFHDLLGRSAGATEITRTERLASGAMSRLDVIQEIMESDEYRVFESGQLPRRAGGEEERSSEFRILGLASWRWRFEGLESLRPSIALYRLLLVESDRDFLYGAYEEHLGRPPEEAEAHRYGAALQRGVARELVLLEILLTEESARRIADLPQYFALVRAVARRLGIRPVSGLSASDLLLKINRLRALREEGFAEAAVKLLFDRVPTPSEAAVVRELSESGPDHLIQIAALIRMGTKSGEIVDGGAAVEWAEEILAAEEGGRRVTTQLRARIDEGAGVDLKETAWLAHSAALPQLRDGGANDGDWVPTGNGSGGSLRPLASSKVTMGGIKHVRQLVDLQGIQLVRMAYRVLLEREADEGGMGYYLDRLRAGVAKETIIRQIATSREGIAVGSKLPGLDALIAADKRDGHWFWGWLTRGARLERKLTRLENGFKDQQARGSGLRSRDRR